MSDELGRSPYNRRTLVLWNISGNEKDSSPEDEYNRALLRSRLKKVEEPSVRYALQVLDINEIAREEKKRHLP